jgi:perosamine synthetase
MPDAPRIPVSEPDIRDADLAEVNNALRSGWISSAGPQLEEFERRWADYCGRRHGVAMSSGTTALELLVEALSLKPGDEVIIPTFTIMSCALAVIRAGGTPVVVDADPKTWCMDTDQVAAAITPRTRAIMPVHIYGHPCDMDVLTTLAAKHDLAIVEDAAEAHGAEYLVRAGAQPGWQRCGSFGIGSAFSFYANKLITTGEGGMVVTNDDSFAARLRSQRNLAFRSDRRFFHTELGHQYRLTNIQAALGLPQIARIADAIARKRAIAAAYRECLDSLESIELQVEQPWARSIHWMFGIVIRDEWEMDAASLALRLAAYGIETRPFFLGMHQQPALRDLGLFRGTRLPVAERLARQGLYLPSGTTLTEAQVDRVCEVLVSVLR